MSNYMNFSSDNINIFMMLFDESHSMEDDTDSVRTGWKMFQKSFNNFPEANSIAVSLSKFSDSFYPEEFHSIENLKFRYYPDGATALYYSIVMGAEYLTNYINSVTERKGVIPKATFIVFSDGEPYNDKAKRADAQTAIQNLNYAGITTVFVAFGKSISSRFGEEMGFVSTIDVKNRTDLVNFLGVELSKSCKEQSKSMKALGANFFSQANNSQSTGYSQKTEQALEDLSWIDEI